MVTATGKVGYIAAVQNIYGVTPPPPEDQHKAIESFSRIIQGIQTQSYELEGLAQAN